MLDDHPTTLSLLDIPGISGIIYLLFNDSSFLLFFLVNGWSTLISWLIDDFIFIEYSYFLN